MSAAGLALQVAVKTANAVSLAFFYLSALRHLGKPKPGFTLVGPITASGSLGKVMRDLAMTFSAAGIPVQTWATTFRKPEALKLPYPPFTPWWKFSARRYSHVLEMFDSGFPAEKLGLQRLTIAFWEFTTGLTEARPCLLHKRHLVAMSDFNVQVFKDLLPHCKVSKLLYPFQMQPDVPSRKDMRARFGIASTDFVVFFNFDYGSSYCRKNPDAVLRAFAAAFPNDKNAKLLFKTMNAQRFPHKAQALVDLARALHVEDRMITVNSYLTQCELYGLTAAVDVYVSLHRGEGFGLGVAEAMYLSKPVIVTNFSSTTEFCNYQTAFPIRYSTAAVPDREEHAYLKHVKTCAEPSVEETASVLKKLRQDPCLCSQVGRAAHEFICRHFALDRFRDSAQKLLNDK